MYMQDQKRLEISCPGLMAVDVNDMTDLNPSWAWALTRKMLLKTKGERALDGTAPKGDQGGT